MENYALLDWFDKEDLQTKNQTKQKDTGKDLMGNKEIEKMSKSGENLRRGYENAFREILSML